MLYTKYQVSYEESGMKLIKKWSTPTYCQIIKPVFVFV